MKLRLILPLLVLAVAALGPWVPVGSPTAPVAGPFESWSGAHVLGTDILGRDVLARVLAGGRMLVVQAAVATLLGSVVGLGVGVWAGMTHRHRAARFTVRGIDALAALPGILLLLVLATGAPGSGAAIVAASVLVSVPFSVRVNRERVAALVRTDYARAAQARGDTVATRLRYDIAPGLAPTALAEAGIRFVAAVQLAATAGFLGLGASAPAANWGRMVQENSAGLTTNPLPVVVPAFLLVVLAVGVTFLLDHLAGRVLGEADRIGAGR
ncbi:ABC transporter permease [Micromonospora craniellae]|uniref:ABC transporter permease subunit n=1 Tax=Micromonospora craniellae TaxID=2294034 RepID=A0A372FZH4_9ACTN|nr:ABC transporter permease subunit [Micromonospora craniellae]QOC93452.1 ABC transporter permease subunit [Micromonospora craniellae]RFS45899.1 ABC transporter permease subunit [Micromonospora craniellae]